MKKSKIPFYFILFLITSFFTSIGVVIAANVNNTSVNNSFKIAYAEEEKRIENQIKALKVKPVDNDKIIQEIDDEIRSIKSDQPTYESDPSLYTDDQNEIDKELKYKNEIINFTANNKVIAEELQTQLVSTMAAHKLAYEKSLQTFNITMSIIIILLGSIFLVNYGYTIILFFKENTIEFNFVNVSKKK